ncbi:MAG: DUF3784 domain-containing protein [Muribaculaceae bacterium]|nr:DUF3784 domain-containing protein [Muribaculaceae bacterium]
MLEAFVILSVVSLVLLVMAIVILSGKGDSLIAGYNTASREVQEAYDKRRVRILVGVLLIVVAVMVPIFGFLLIRGYKDLIMVVFPATVFIIVAATFTSAHFWAKKKDKKNTE